MKPISVTASHAMNSLTNDAPENSTRQSHVPRALRVWKRLHEMYGDRFLREFGAEPNDTWVATIARISDQEIIASLKALAQTGSPHPCSLPEFVKASRPETGSPRYLGANPINMTELRIAGLLPQGEKKVHDATQLRAALRSAQPSE